MELYRNFHILLQDVVPNYTVGGGGNFTVKRIMTTDFLGNLRPLHKFVMYILQIPVIFIRDISLSVDTSWDTP
jgi:hypothetical protein